MLQVPDSIFWKIAADETAWGLQLAMRELPELDYGRCLIFADRLEELGYEQAGLFCRATSHYLSNQAMPSRYHEDGKFIKSYMKEQFGVKFGKSNVIGSKLVSCVALPSKQNPHPRSRNCLRFEDRRGYHFFVTPFLSIPLLGWESTRFISSHFYSPVTTKEAITYSHFWNDINFLRLRKLTGENERNEAKQVQALHKARQSYLRAVAKQEGWYWIADLD